MSRRTLVIVCVAVSATVLFFVVCLGRHIGRTAADKQMEETQKQLNDLRAAIAAGQKAQPATPPATPNNSAAPAAPTTSTTTPPPYTTAPHGHSTPAFSASAPSTDGVRPETPDPATQAKLAALDLNVRETGKRVGKAELSYRAAKDRADLASDRQTIQNDISLSTIHRIAKLREAENDALRNLNKIKADLNDAVIALEEGRR